MSGWAAGVGAGIGVAVVLGLVRLAVGDVQTGRVPRRWSRVLTALAVGGLGLTGVIDRAWGPLATAGLGAALVTGIQLVPYGLQARSGRAAIGRADVRLGVPFGATLGWFGIGFTVIGFALALVAGLATSAVLRRRQLPFVPFLAAGHLVALGWGVVAVSRRPSGRGGREDRWCGPPPGG